MTKQTQSRWTVGANALDEWGLWTHKGEYDGQCQGVACMHEHARWLNEKDARYYCSACARALNDNAARNGEPDICVLYASNDD